MDKFDKQFYEKLKKRRDDGEPYENFYARELNVGMSNNESRKRLYGIDDYLTLKNEIAISEKLDVKYQESLEKLADGKYKSDKLLYMNKDQQKDDVYLLEAHGFDASFWELVTAKNNIWNVYSKQDGVQQLYSSKITVKPLKEPFNVEWIRDTIDEYNFKNKPKETSLLKNETENNVVVEINFADVHIGKFVNELVSNGVYDTNIAINRYNDAIDKGISKIKNKNIDKIIYVIGQDFINIDTIEGTTNKGTRQDMHTFYESIYKSALKCLIDTVEKLRQISNVEIIYIKGNHDKQSTFTMACALESIYNNVNGVTVDSGLKQRKYVEFGNVLIGFSHGEDEKSRIFGCMQEDAKEFFYKDRKYFHLSHFHSEKEKEMYGIKFQWLGSLSENCNWTWSSGFVGSEKQGHIFVYDYEYGLEEEYFIKV